MKKSIKFVISIFLLLSIFLISISAHDILGNDTFSTASGTSELFHLIAVEENTRGIYAPTQTWDFQSQGIYELDGYANNSTLYSEYRFTGSNFYALVLTNRDESNERLVRCCRASDGEVLMEFKIPPNTTVTKALTTTNVWYVCFPGGFWHGGTNVCGTISG